jgi:hypothetical protein
MSIIQQLAEIESKANKYKNQRTLRIYANPPRAGADNPSLDIRVDFDTEGDKSSARWLLEFLKDHGICAMLYVSSSVEGTQRNFNFLPRKELITEGQI